MRLGRNGSKLDLLVFHARKMSESNTSPDVVNVLTSHDKKFVLRIYAYRRLTALEMRFCLTEYLRSHRLRKIPAKGEAEMHTIIGLDEQ